jgi:hypothetical protein
MRLVVDTNVFVSAALKESSWPAHTIRWLERYGGLLKVRRLSQRPRFKNKISRGFFDQVARILATAEAVTIVERIALCCDPEDDKFIELAVKGRADLIVSGDADLLALDTVHQIAMVPPSTFVLAGQLGDEVPATASSRR